MNILKLTLPILLIALIILGVFFVQKNKQKRQLEPFKESVVLEGVLGDMICWGDTEGVKARDVICHHKLLTDDGIIIVFGSYVDDRNSGEEMSLVGNLYSKSFAEETFGLGSDLHKRLVVEEYMETKSRKIVGFLDFAQTVEITETD